MAKKTTSDDAPKKKSGVQKHLAVWLLLGMIVTGLGGWGVTNFGANIDAIGKVGPREIPAVDYARGLQQALDNFSAQFGMKVTIEQAQAFGLDRQVLQDIVLRTAMDAEGYRLGLSVGDAIVAEQIKVTRAFQGVSGFDRAIYGDTLKQNGMNEKTYESGIRLDMARQILRGAVTGGLVVPEAMVDAVFAWQFEKRGFTWVQLTEAGLPAPLAAPMDADLTTHYDTNIADFTRPAGKKITYAVLQPETLVPEMAVDDAAVTALYEARADQYQVPEKRLVERLVYPTEDEAKAARARLDTGEATFEALVQERGLALMDIDLGDLGVAELGAAGEAVFALTDPGVVGPLPSDLGPALFRMNGILAAQTTTLDEVRAELQSELQLDAARKAIADRVEAIDDALAGGATLAELATDQAMALVTTDYAPGAEDNDPITNDTRFAEAADRMVVGDYAEAILLDNGGVAAMQIDADVPATPIPFDKVRDKVTAAWSAQALQDALSLHATEVKAQVEAGASLSGFGIASVTPPVTRDHQISDAPAAVMDAIFAMAPGEVRVIETPGWVGLMLLSVVEPAKGDDEAAKAAREQISALLRQGMGSDVGALYGQALLADQQVTLDQGAINAVNAGFR